MTDPRSCSCGEIHQIPAGWSMYRCASCGVVVRRQMDANGYTDWRVLQANIFRNTEQITGIMGEDAR